MQVTARAVAVVENIFSCYVFVNGHLYFLCDSLCLSATLRLDGIATSRSVAVSREVSAEGLCAFYLMPEKCTGKSNDQIDDKFDE